jgi:hypothetical protein
VRERKPVLVTCGHCRGSGKIELHGAYRATLAMVPVIAWSPTGAIAERVGTSVARTALIERLNTLMDHGLIERRKADARGYEWRQLASQQVNQ